jgi:hypothetical protein
MDRRAFCRAAAVGVLPALSGCGAPLPYGVTEPTRADEPWSDVERERGAEGGLGRWTATGTVPRHEYAVHEFQLRSTADVAVRVDVRRGPATDVLVTSPVWLSRFQEGEPADHALAATDVGGDVAGSVRLGAGWHALAVDNSTLGDAGPADRLEVATIREARHA